MHTLLANSTDQLTLENPSLKNIDDHQSLLIFY